MVASSHKSAQAKKRAFLAAYAKSGNISTAAEAAGIDRRRHYEWLADDPDGSYAAAVAAAYDQAGDYLEEKARQRATEGWEEPVWYQGDEVGRVRKYSDTLLIFLLKGAKPDKYRERGTFEHTGKDGGPIEHKHDGSMNLTLLDDGELDDLQRLVGKAHGQTADADGDSG